MYKTIRSTILIAVIALMLIACNQEVQTKMPFKTPTTKLPALAKPSTPIPIPTPAPAYLGVTAIGPTAGEFPGGKFPIYVAAYLIQAHGDDISLDTLSIDIRGAPIIWRIAVSVTGKTGQLTTVSGIQQNPIGETLWKDGPQEISLSKTLLLSNGETRIIAIEIGTFTFALCSKASSDDAQKSTKVSVTFEGVSSLVHTIVADHCFYS